MDDVRWRGATGSSRTVIRWPEGRRPRDGASAPSLTKEQALMFLKGIAEGREPTALAELNHGQDSLFLVTHLWLSN